MTDEQIKSDPDLLDYNLMLAFVSGDMAKFIRLGGDPAKWSLKV